MPLRLLRRIRKNPDYQYICQWAEEHGFEVEVKAAKGRGHCYALLTRGDQSFKIGLSSSPTNAPVNHLRIKLENRLAKVEGRPPPYHGV